MAARKRIGELLLERGVITPEQLEAGLAAQQRTRQRLGVTLIQLGSLSEVQLAQALGQSLAISTVDLNQVQVDWSAVHMLRTQFCETHELFPFAVDGKGTQHKRLLVAMSDPLNRAAIEEIEFTTGLEVASYVSTHSQVRAAILRYYHKQSAPLPKPSAGQPPSAPPRASAPKSPVVAPPSEDEPPMVVGHILTSAQTAPPVASASVSRDLDILFGARGDETDVEKLERRFWALLRIMQRKGMLTRDEFLAELEREI